MGYMKWVKGLMDTGRHSVLRNKYVEAVDNNQSRIDFDNGNYDIKYIENVLTFIDSQEDGYQSTRKDVL